MHIYVHQTDSCIMQYKFDAFFQQGKYVQTCMYVTNAHMNLKTFFAGYFL